MAYFLVPPVHQNHNIGRLSSITSPGGYSEVFSFDVHSRLVQQSVTADGTTYIFNQAYVAATGLLDTLEYPTSTAGYRLKLKNEYASGLLKRVKDANSATVFWEATSTDAWGHVQDETFGNGVTTFTDFDQASGLMSARQGGVGGGIGLINSQVDWDLNGNLIERQDLKLSPNVAETFTYDSLNRFDSSTRNGTTNADVTLNAIGNISWKMGVGNYAYHATKKRAVITAGSNSFGYDANGNMNSRNGSTIGYTSYNLPSSIAAGSNSSALYYGAFRNRYKQVAVASGATETTIYVAGLLEKMTKGGVTEYRHMIPGGSGTAAIYTRRSDATTNTYYVHSDHLGSPELITNSSGVAVVRPSFGAYGERRDGTDWDGAPTAGDLTTIGNVSRRGFTGHEHLDAVGLIHMNGRVFEPVAGRFLSQDPFIDGVFSSQGTNGYAYVHNNPLTFTDPSGFCGSLFCWRWTDSGGNSTGGTPVGGGGENSPVAAGPGLGGDGGNLPVNRTDRGVVGEVDGLSQGFLNAVPGAYYAGQSQFAWGEGHYLLGAVLYAAALGDAALGVVTLGESTALVGSIRTGGTILVRALRLPNYSTSLGRGVLGATDAAGNVTIAAGLTRTEQMLTMRHESVHAFFSARGNGAIARHRQQLGMWGYNNSQLLRFTEEALAEGYATRSLSHGLAHPLNNGYGITPFGLFLEGSILGGAFYGGNELIDGD